LCRSERNGLASSEQVDPNDDSLGQVKRQKSPQTPNRDARYQAGDRYSITKGAVLGCRPEIHAR